MKSRRGEDQRPSPLQRFLAWDWCLLTCCFIGVGLGFAVGLALYYQNASSDVIMWVGLPGELYMRMLKAAVLPLLISAIITGTAGLKPKENGKVSMVSLAYIIITNVIGALLGVVLALIIKPGVTEDSVSDGQMLDTGHLQTSDLFADLIRNLVPDNVVSACFQKTQTGYRTVKVSVPVTLTADNLTSITNTTIANMTTVDTLKRYIGKAGGTNILGLVIVCTAVGMATAQKGEVARPFVNFFTAASEVMMLLVQWLVMFTPVGTASLIASSVGGTSDLEETFRGLGLFVLAETLGNALLILVMLPLLHFLFMRRNPFSWMLGASRAAIMAMVTASSVVAMPEHMKNVETRYGVDKRVTSFVVPLVTAINRDGSTMFIALTAVYMAQLQNATSVDTVVLITILSAVGSLAIPATASASVVTILMIMDSLGVQPANIGILLALEWFSDRMRTLSNNYSHVLCCLITWHLCKSSLQAPSLEDGPGIEGKLFHPQTTDDSSDDPRRPSSSTEEGSSSSPLLDRNVNMDNNMLEGEGIPLRFSKNSQA